MGPGPVEGIEEPHGINLGHPLPDLTGSEPLDGTRHGDGVQGSHRPASGDLQDDGGKRLPEDAGAGEGEAEVAFEDFQ